MPLLLLGGHLWSLILFGPFLVVAPLWAAAAVQCPEWRPWTRAKRPAPRTRLAWCRPAPAWAVAR